MVVKGVRVRDILGSVRVHQNNGGNIAGGGDVLCNLADLKFMGV